MTLYEIATEYKEFVEAVENGEVPEEAITDTLESIQALLEEKADNIACLIKNLTSDAEAIKAEETRLTERRKQKEATADRLKTYLSDMLIKSGCTNLETARNKMSFRKSEVVTVDNEATFIEWAMNENRDLLTFKAPTISKTAIKKALAEGQAIDGVRIESKSNLQIK